MDVGVWVDVQFVSILGLWDLVGLWNLMHTNKTGEEELVFFLVCGNNPYFDVRTMTTDLPLGLNGIDIYPPTPTHQFSERNLIIAMPVPTSNPAIDSADP